MGGQGLKVGQQFGRIPLHLIHGRTRKRERERELLGITRQCVFHQGVGLVVGLLGKTLQRVFILVVIVIVVVLAYVEKTVFPQAERLMHFKYQGYFLHNLLLLSGLFYEPTQPYGHVRVYLSFTAAS